MHIIGHARHFFGRGVVAKGVCGVERVFAEFLAQCRLQLLYLCKAFALCAYQIGATQDKVAQCVLVRLALLGVQGLHVDRFVFGVQPFVRTQAGPKLCNDG